ncbi:MAG: DnaA/Hda family protein [Pseudomonadota bacterium]
MSNSADQGDGHPGENVGRQQGPAVWARVKAQLKSQVSEDIYHNWLSDLRFVAEVDGAVLIAARRQYTFDRVNRDHRQLIQRTWSRHDPQSRIAKLACWDTASSDLRTLVEDPWKEADIDDEATEAGVANGSDGTKSASATAMTFANLITGPSNAVAVNTAFQIAAGEQFPAGTLVMISGPQGVGKTHILNALAEEAAARDPDRRVVYMTAEEFMVSYVDGARSGDTRALKARARSCDIIMIDDLQTLAGKRKTDSEFFSTLRSVTSKGGIAVLTADAVSADLHGLSPQMRNELKGAVKIEVGLPDREMRTQIIQSRSLDIQSQAPLFKLTPEMEKRILKRVRGPGRSLCGILWSLYIETQMGIVEPTLEMLDSIIRRQEGELQPASIDAVKRATCKVFDVTKVQLESKSKQQTITYPRHIAVYVARQKTAKSFPQIGRAFGGRDHATCIHSFKKITKDIEVKPEVQADVKRVMDTLYDLLSGQDD